MMRSRTTRARWIIRLSILSLPLLLFLGLWLSWRSASLSAAQKVDWFFQNAHEDMPYAEVEARLGPYDSEEYQNGRVLHWHLVVESLNETRYYDLRVKVWEGQVVDHGSVLSHMTGASTWRWRWYRFRAWVGF